MEREGQRNLCCQHDLMITMKMIIVFEGLLLLETNGFRRNRSTTSQILTIRRILESVRAKNLEVTILFVDFTKAFESIHRGKMEQILLA